MNRHHPAYTFQGLCHYCRWPVFGEVKVLLPLRRHMTPDMVVIHKDCMEAMTAVTMLRSGVHDPVLIIVVDSRLP